MEPKHRQAIAKHSHLFTKDLDVDANFLQYLVSQSVITPAQMEQLDTIPSSTEKALHFKQLIVKRGRRAFPALIEALMETNQGHIAEALSCALSSEWIRQNPSRSKGPRDVPSSYRFLGDEDAPEIDVKLKAVSKQKLAEVMEDPEKYYRMTSGKRGLAIIVNNDFKHAEEGERLGCEVDARNLEELYQALGFQVKLWPNLNVEEIKTNINALTEDPDLIGDAFIFTILSHGDKLGILTKNGRLNLEEDIIQRFSASDCQALAGKPKVFILQACRGPKESITEADGSDKVVFAGLQDTVLETAIMKDYFVMYSTVEGYKAYRDTTLGSWFVRDFVFSFMQSCHEDDFEKLMTKVIMRMDNRKYTQNGDMIKQIGCKTSRLRKKLHFLPHYRLQ